MVQPPAETTQAQTSLTPLRRHSPIPISPPIPPSSSTVHAPNIHSMIPIPDQSNKRTNHNAKNHRTTQGSAQPSRAYNTLPTHIRTTRTVTQVANADAGPVFSHQPASQPASQLAHSRSTNRRQKADSQTVRQTEWHKAAQRKRQ
ncbi:uncharacterized protein K452DRAFT_10154 [Aplosporella prunicola CBS 121167]|uniref:Uncharacterized protein n=1 Tax=Aplosporella prunicola CBS 121167 TaxID=1176127 RepID=A0A6A6BJJ2_9PEZI|nr:uncharacterized protein K452DRAFT_10154 [Aplosporella prunicola CBS 121167]KAF2142741.1 hypothetical protein K452DRAFT_10154 [Aplosporella prunicola CBS 121167]